MYLYVLAKYIFTFICFWNDKKMAMLIVSLKQKKNDILHQT